MERFKMKSSRSQTLINLALSSKTTTIIEPEIDDKGVANDEDENLVNLPSSSKTTTVNLEPEIDDAVEANDEEDNALAENSTSRTSRRRVSDLNEDFSGGSSSEYIPESSDQSEPESSTSSEIENDMNTENTQEVTQVKKKRRRHADPASWNKNIVKMKRLSGQEYVNRAGKIISAKKPKDIDCSLCRFKCSTHFNQEQREIICKEYWELADYSKQKLYLSSLIITKEVARRRTGAKKLKRVSKEYHLKAMGGSLIRVCLKFLCFTLSISHRSVDNINQSLTQSGNYLSGDKRVGKKPANATPEAVINEVKNHIDSFPRVESHYCRRDTKKKYLASDLNTSKMYRLYLENCTTPVSLYIYRQTFNSYDPPLGFFIPKKDQCVKCNIYHAAVDKSNVEAEWKLHKEREKAAMDMKDLDKQKAINGKGTEFRSISFDLQGILSTPFAAEAEIYYKRKLNVYNFTIYEQHNKDGHCFVWDECNGQKGSNEIGTCILKYLSMLPSTVNHITTFSDTCGGQNRNKNICGAMLYAVNKFDNINCIDLKYMESGHSYLEADAMHGAIERARKHKKVYTTREWALLISAARINPRPYNVLTLKNSDFYDLKKLTTVMIHNTTKNNNKETVNWLKIKWLRFNKQDPHKILYKYSLDEDVEFLEIDINQKRNAEIIPWDGINLEPAYKDMLCISEAKKKDLLSLLTNGVIPPDYKHFYNSLPAARKILPRDEHYSEDDE